jgi:hypothetical protein
VKSLTCTLLTDGPSDQVLLKPLVWLLRRHGVVCPIQSEWADLRQLPKPPKGLPARIRKSLELFPCDLLFLHRDAEREPREKRIGEIRDALGALPDIVLPVICVVPVRMQEAWLLFDEAAIRRAAGNRNGTVSLSLPPLKDVERLPNPKHDLQELLKTASELHGRRRSQLNLPLCARRVAEYIEDFAPLDALTAFNALSADVRRVAAERRWIAS